MHEWLATTLSVYHCAEMWVIMVFHRKREWERIEQNTSRNFPNGAAFNSNNANVGSGAATVDFLSNQRGNVYRAYKCKAIAALSYQAARWLWEKGTFRLTLIFPSTHRNAPTAQWKSLMVDAFNIRISKFTWIVVGRVRGLCSDNACIQSPLAGRLSAICGCCYTYSTGYRLWR